MLASCWLGAAQAANKCEVPAELANVGAALPHVAAKLKAGLPITIVALGSSSTSGVGASTPAANYPSCLERDLQAMFPLGQVRVINQGVAGEVASDMLRRLDRDVIAEQPDLVIWQTGTNDVIRRVPVREFERLTRLGIERLKQAGADVMIMEPQYYPKLLLNADYMAYLHSLRSLGEQQEVSVLRRFDIMLHWIQSAQLTYATMLAGDAFHMKDQSYACLAQVVAHAIARAAGLPVAPQQRLTASAPQG